MESLSRRRWASDRSDGRSVGRRLAAGGLIAAGLVMLATAPAEAGGKHKHKHHNYHHYYHHYDYDDDDDYRVIYVPPRPVYVAPPPVIYYEPAPVIYPQPSFNVIIPLDFD